MKKNIMFLIVCAFGFVFARAAEEGWVEVGKENPIEEEWVQVTAAPETIIDRYSFVNLQFVLQQKSNIGPKSYTVLVRATVEKNDVGPTHKNYIKSSSTATFNKTYTLIESTSADEIFSWVIAGFNWIEEKAFNYTHYPLRDLQVSFLNESGYKEKPAIMFNTPEVRLNAGPFAWPKAKNDFARSIANTIYEYSRSYNIF